MNLTVGLHIYISLGMRRVIAEPGMRLSVLTSLLETVGLSLDLSGRLPDLDVVDALAIDLIGQCNCPLTIKRLYVFCSYGI